MPRRGAAIIAAVQIGFAINETLALVTLATGICWWLWRRRRATAGRPVPWWMRFGADLFAAAALIFGCRFAVADWPRVPTGSMEPTLRVGDYLLVNHLAYGPRLPFTNWAIEFGRPQRGDVVVFRYPLDVSSFYVKRLVGLPGDRVAFRDGTVTVNGLPTNVQHLGDGLRDEDRGQWLLRETAGGPPRELKINPFVQGRIPELNRQAQGIAQHCVSERAGAWDCTVPAGQYLMLGDNRDNSADSRVWGFLPHGQVYGKAVRVLINFSEPERAWRAL